MSSNLGNIQPFIAPGPPPMLLSEPSLLPQPAFFSPPLASPSFTPPLASPGPSSAPPLASSPQAATGLGLALSISGSGQSATNSQNKKRKSDHGASNRSKRSNTSTEAKENLILLNGVQGSLNLVADTIRSINTPESNIDNAVKIAQTEIHGLDEVDKVLIGSFFSQYPNKAAAFCGYSPGVNRDTFIMVELEQFKAEHHNLVALVKNKLSQQQERV